MRDYCGQKRRDLVRRDGGEAQVPLPGVPRSSRPKLLHTREHRLVPGVGTVPDPKEEPRMGYMCTERRGETLRLGVLRLLLHDLQNHLAGGGAALGRGVDADGFFCSSCVFFPVHVDPASKGWALGPGSSSAASRLLRTPHIPMDRRELTLERKVTCTQGRRQELILGSLLDMDALARSSNHSNPNKASPSIYFKQQERLSGGTSTCLGDGMGCPSLYILDKAFPGGQEP